MSPVRSLEHQICITHHSGLLHPVDIPDKTQFRVTQADVFILVSAPLSDPSEILLALPFNYMWNLVTCPHPRDCHPVQVVSPCPCLPTRSFLNQVARVNLIETKSNLSHPSSESSVAPHFSESQSQCLASCWPRMMWPSVPPDPLPAAPPQAAFSVAARASGAPDTHPLWGLCTAVPAVWDTVPFGPVASSHLL